MTPVISALILQLREDVMGLYDALAEEASPGVLIALSDMCHCGTAALLHEFPGEMEMYLVLKTDASIFKLYSTDNEPLSVKASQCFRNLSILWELASPSSL